MAVPRALAEPMEVGMRVYVALVLACLTLMSSEVMVQSATAVFKGRPSLKISEGGIERTPEQLTRDRAVNLDCVISQIGSKYYWASRENVELARIEGGAFITFVALNGAGYVRIIKPEQKTTASLMSASERDFDYVEHALIGLRSVTYYGKVQ